MNEQDVKHNIESFGGFEGWVEKIGENLYLAYFPDQIAEWHMDWTDTHDKVRFILNCLPKVKIKQVSIKGCQSSAYDSCILVIFDTTFCTRG